MDGVAVTVEYAAPSAPSALACPSDADFWAAFSSRAEHAVRSERGEWSIVVRLERFPKGRFHGTLRVLHGNAPPLERELEDDSCSDLATAFAVVAAITVESAPRPKPPPREWPPSDSPIDLPPPVLPEERIHLRAGVGSEATSFLSPVASAGLAAFFEVEAPRGILAPRARIGAHFATSFPFKVDSASANISCVFARIEVGGVRLRFARALALRLAAIADVGVMLVEGRDADFAQTASAPLIDLGAIARFAWETPIFFIELAGGGVAPLTRSAFHFDSRSGARALAFEVPAVGAIGEVGVGVRFF